MCLSYRDEKLLMFKIKFSLMFKIKLILEKKNITVTQWQDIYFHVPRIYQNKGQKVCLCCGSSTLRDFNVYLFMPSFQTLPIVGLRKMFVKFDKQMLYQHGLFLIQDLSTQPEKTCTFQKPSALWPESSILFGPFTVKKVWINFVGKSH